MSEGVVEAVGFAFAAHCSVRGAHASRVALQFGPIMNKRIRTCGTEDQKIKACDFLGSTKEEVAKESAQIGLAEYLEERPQG